MAISKYFSLLTVFLTVIVLTTNLSAQISLGLQGGVNISKTVVDNDKVQSKISGINSFTLGAVINYKINSIISLQSELRYLRSGNEQNISGTVKVTDYFNYLEVPIYAVAELPNSSVSPFVLAGINMGYLLKATQKYYFHNDDDTELFNRTNFAIDVGLGVKHSFYKNIWVQLSGIYSYGIYNIEKDLANRKTRGIQIVLGVLYDI
jgi:opacity protein-like surface antigen